MRIDKKQTICNIPVLKIRDFLKHCHRSSDFYADNFFKYIQVDETEGEVVIKELINQGYIVQVNNLYKVTEKGQSLRVARCIAPLSRQKGEKILKEFLERVEEINNDEGLAHYVKKVYLFGSFLDKEKNDYSDIDLGIEVKRKIKSEKEYKKRCREIANKSGRTFAFEWEEMDYAESCVLLKLKNRNQYISLHTLYDKVLQVTEKRKIYSFKK